MYKKSILHCGNVWPVYYSRRAVDALHCLWMSLWPPAPRPQPEKSPKFGLSAVASSRRWRTLPLVTSLKKDDGRNPDGHNPAPSDALQSAKIPQFYLIRHFVEECLTLQQLRQQQQQHGHYTSFGRVPEAVEHSAFAYEFITLAGIFP